MNAAGDTWIIGAGRMGLALGSELVAARAIGPLRVVGRGPKPPSHAIFSSLGATYESSLPAGKPPDLILIATSDSGIDDVVAALLLHFPAPALVATTVLHTSGVLGSDSLSPLEQIGASTGSLHPLVSIADAERDSVRLRGAWFAVEGDPEAVTTADALVAALDGHSLRIAPGEKAAYHAAAVFASNYIVSVMSVAERLMRDSGVEAEAARAALSTLAGGTLSNVAAVGPMAALTGPVSRGDAATVERHLQRLSVADRLLYSGLAREALDLAMERGLSDDAAKRISDLLESERP